MITYKETIFETTIQHRIDLLLSQSWITSNFFIIILSSIDYIYDML